jgi:hypothetical protein
MVTARFRNFISNWHFKIRRNTGPETVIEGTGKLSLKKFDETSSLEIASE